MEVKMDENVSNRQLERYPMYLSHLLMLSEAGVVNISAPTIAAALHLNVEQVRKDLQAVSSSEGKPKFGRNVEELIADLKKFLGYNETNKAIVVGVGHLGQAFLNYSGFTRYGLDIVMGFDIDPLIVGSEINGKPIYSLDEIGKYLADSDIKIAVLTTPQGVAQEASDVLTKNGIRGIWNFTPIHLSHPLNVVVEDMNLASSLAKFSHRLQILLKKEKS